MSLPFPVLSTSEKASWKSAGTGTLTVSFAGTQTFGGTLRDGDGVGTDGSLAFTKSGSGHLTLAGATAHTGGTTVNGGILTVDGTLGSGTTLALPNATVNGFGSINGPVNVQVGGTLANDGSNQTAAGLDANATFQTTNAIIQNDEATAPGYTGDPGPANLTIDTDGTHSFTGLIRNQAGGALNIIKNGPGTQEIRNVTAAAHNFGTLNIDEGKFTLNFNGVNNTLGAGSTVTIAAGATTVLRRSAARRLTPNSKPRVSARPP